MPDLLRWSEARVPTGVEANHAASYMAAFGNDIDPKLIHDATSVADRDLRYGDLPDGSQVNCAALKASWIKIPGGWFTAAIDTGWVTTGFTYPTAAWVAGPWAKIRNRGGLIELRVRVIHQGADIIASPSGNLIDTTVAKIPSSYNPVGESAHSQSYLLYGGATVYVTTLGEVRLADAQPDLTIYDGAELSVTARWMEG